MSVKKISNPLTIIGVFAGIAEALSAAVFPFIEGDIQQVFVWFVMGFPVLLVLLFFILLVFKPTSLYAPSDYRDENNFVDLMRRDVQGLQEDIGELAEAKDVSTDLKVKLAAAHTKISSLEEKLEIFEKSKSNKASANDIRKRLLKLRREGKLKFKHET